MAETNIDTRKLVAYFGGKSSCQRTLSKAGFPTTIKAVEKWVERQSIRGERIAQLVVADFKVNGRILNIQDFVLTEEAQ